MGLTRRRLAAESLLATVTKNATRHLHPSQLAFGTANGCDAIVHSIRRWRRCHDNNEERCPMTMHGLGDHFQPDRQVLLSEGSPTSRARIGLVQ